MRQAHVMYWSAIKKKKILPFVTRGIDLEGVFCQKFSIFFFSGSKYLLTKEITHYIQINNFNI